MTRHILAAAAATALMFASVGQADARPDPNVTYSVPVAGSASHGPRHALVTIVEAFDFACPHCKRAAVTMRQIANIYGNKVRFVYKNFVIYKKRSTTAARAGCAAKRMGAFKAMYDLIYADQRKLDGATMERYAGRLGLNLNKFRKHMQSCQIDLATERAQVTSLGVLGAPAFFINGRLVSGNQPLKNFQRVIDEELKKAKQVVAAGMPLGKYYREMVVKRGRKKP